MSGITDPGDKTPAEIEREVEQTRSDVSSTLDELREKLKPSQMMDEVVEEATNWIKGSGGGEFARNLGATIRDNPLPVLLIGAGIAWMLLGGRGSSSSGRAYAYEAEGDHGYDVSRYRDDAYDGRGAPAYGAHGASSSSGGIASTVTDAASRAAASVSGAVSSAASAVGEAVSNTTASLATTGSEGADYVARRASAQFRDAEPFLYGALGLAIGAGLGAILPATEAEHRLMGEHSQEAMRMAREGVETVRHIAEDKLAEAKDTIVETYEGTMERLDREGIANAPRILGDAATEVGMAAQETIRSAAEDAKRELKG